MIADLKAKMQLWDLWNTEVDLKSLNCYVWYIHNSGEDGESDSNANDKNN
jgi:hypothetical protein